MYLSPDKQTARGHQGVVIGWDGRALALEVNVHDGRRSMDAFFRKFQKVSFFKQKRDQAISNLIFWSISILTNKKYLDVGVVGQSIGVTFIIKKVINSRHIEMDFRVKVIRFQSNSALKWLVVKNLPICE